MDRILNFILTGIRDKDVFKLQDPSTCQKYLLVSVEQLKSLFTEIQLYPVRGPGGKILFRRIEDITRPTEAAAKEQLAENCLAIGYFYVRILQLYLALALTIIDDPVIAGYAGQAPVAPGFQRGGEAPPHPLNIGGEASPHSLNIGDEASPHSLNIGGEASPHSLRGGGSEFTFDALTRLPDEHLAFIDLRSQRPSGLYSIPRKDESDPMSVRLIPKSQNEGLIYGLTTSRFDARGTKREMKAKYYIKLIEGRGDALNKIRVVQARIPRDQRDGSGVVERDISIDVPITDDYKLLVPYGQPYRGSIVKEITPFLRKLLVEFEQGNIKNLTVSYAQKIAGYRGRSETNYIEERPAAAAGFSFQPQAGRPLVGSSSQAALDFRGALAAVQQTRPLAHCVARSYQLLAMDTMAGAKQARTQICNRSFMTRTKVPDGGPITGIEGIKALQLLYSVLDKTKIGLTARSSTGLQVALNMFAQAFGDGRQAASMDRIVARTPASCGGKTGPATISGAQDIGKAKAGVQALWAFQRKHLADVAGMFKLLFNVSREGAVIGFNPRILAGGIPYVEELVEKTQAILANYYSQCESIYQNTVAGLSSVQLDATGAGAGAR